MAIKTKSRKVFKLNKFRGLDTENKLLKVAPFRATSGKNFIIDSESLKTRPALKLKNDLPFILDTDEHIIDYYHYNDIYIYITNQHMRFVDGATIFDETDIDNVNIQDKLIIPTLTFDFTDMTPLFKEEKDCLFMFGLDDIYVFSKLVIGVDYRYVLYRLGSKPSLDNSDDFFDLYTELPKPYEPTVFIGDDRLDDVNVLSNVTKYKIFTAQNKSFSNGENLYELPTHYNVDNHGGYTASEIKFYGGAIDGLDCLPVYHGIKDEDFVSDVSTHVLGTAIDIENTFFPVEPWEYKYNDPDTTALSTFVGLNKEDFFSFTVKGTNKNVFEYLISWIELDNTDFGGDNKYLKFNLPVVYREIVRVEGTNALKTSTTKETTVEVFVQLKKYETVSHVFTERYSGFTPITQSLSRETTDYDNPVNVDGYFDSTNTKANAHASFYWESGFTNIVPDVQDVVYYDNTGDKYYYFNGTAYVEFDVVTELQPIERPDIGNIGHEDLRDVALQENKSSYTNGDKILLKSYYNQEDIVIHDRFVDFELNDFDWAGEYEFTLGNPATYPPYLGHAVPNEVIDVENPIYNENTVALNNLSEETQTRIKNEIDKYIDDLTDDFANHNVLARIRLYGLINDVWKMQSANIWIDYDKGIDQVRYLLISSADIMDVSTDTTEILDNLYKFSYNNTKNAFELRVKDYFVDLRNEPSIDVRIVFDNNPDYKLISKCKFGTTFGSEDRLFLSGNPDYPNTDYYNVSNDLLGNNDKSQSYELSYFPSKNYRVIGGKGAINGYVIATDSQMYITKADYPNDANVFIRERNINDEGSVSYREYKTSINKTPLNHTCVARFYNDVVMLTKDGLYGLEISNNVQTNERLIKLRSSFVNKEIIEAIKTATNVFMAENNHYLYIFIDDKVYVADSRYLAKDEDGEVGNYNYEIVRWELPYSCKRGKFIDDMLVVINTDGNQLYKVEEDARDDMVSYHSSAISNVDVASLNVVDKAFLLPTNLGYVLDSPVDVSFKMKNIYKTVAFKDVSKYTVSGNEITIVDDVAFGNVNDGDTLYFDNGSSFEPFTVSQFEENGRTKFTCSDISYESGSTGIYTFVEDVPLFISSIFTIGSTRYMRLCTFRKSTITEYTQGGSELDQDYYDRIDADMVVEEEYVIPDGMQDVRINREQDIILEWYSSISDFGNELMEKTMFRTNIYATRQEQEHILLYGYATQRRLKALEDSSQLVVGEVIELAQKFTFNSLDFYTFTVSTFNDFGMSIPTKENNFLYMQLMIKGKGIVQLNAIEILYKDNRMLRTIG